MEKTFKSSVILFCIRNYYLVPKSDIYVFEFSDFEFLNLSYKILCLTAYKKMLHSVSIEVLYLLARPNCPTDNQARHLAHVYIPDLVSH